MNRKTISLLTIVSVVVLGMMPADVSAQKKRNIKNDVFWKTRDGQPINSQGGGIFRFPDPVTGRVKYYWYGVHYKEADVYRNDPSVTLGQATFESVTCYSSADLVNWTFEGDVLTREEVIRPGTRSWVGRLGVAWVPQLKKYAMFVQHDKEVLIAVSSTVTGKFTWHRKISMKDMIGTSNTGDQTVFTDEDSGTSYLVYSYGNERNRIYISEIGVRNGMVDLLDCTKVFQGESREGNCMFKYQGRYYMVASNIYGWDASHAYYLVADSIRGPYRPANEMLVMNGCAEDYAHVTQTGFFFSVRGRKKETIVYCGDRWANFAGNGLGYNHWFPLSFDGATPYFNSLGSWNLDPETGEWSVAADNNYVRNGSFEADRKRIPSTVKPVQLQLTGWVATVIEGTEISLDTNQSPALNHFNSQEDRSIVVGEKSLSLHDQVNFKRRVSQTISGTPYVKLAEGNYSLVAKVRNSAGFSRLQMYAETGGKTFTCSIVKDNAAWTEIRINRIPVRGGKVEIGFIAEGAGGSFCYVDDVSLVKMK